MTRRWCGIHGGEVPEAEAEIVSATEAGSGPSVPAYACIACIRRDGIVPPRPARTPTYVGYRDASPSRPA